tara:strand:- start:92 stop:685 length:594 start_codon:yes stop_codon:yes gene_type:complete
MSTITKGEIFRKLIHLSNLVIPIGYLFFIPSKTHILLILGCLSVLFITVDFFRTKSSWLESIFEKLFNFMLRSYELKGRLTGATWVVTGAFLTVAIFPKEIAILALLFMGLGDTVAGLIGSHFGRIKIWNKTLEGTLAGLAICFLITGFFPGVSIWIRISGAVSAMLAELSPIPLDDNILIPLVSGTIMVVISTLVT